MLKVDSVGTRAENTTVIKALYTIDRKLRKENLRIPYSNRIGEAGIVKRNERENHTLRSFTFIGLVRESKFTETHLSVLLSKLEVNH